jgi:hypothetical protein
VPTDYPTQVTDTTPTFLVGGDATANAGAGGPAKALCSPVGLLLLNATTTSAAQVALGLGAVSPRSANATLAAADDGSTIVATGSLTFTVNTGLPVGFGVTLVGTVAFSGTATVTDQRATGSANPLCALLQTGTDIYLAVGGKP